MNQILLVEDESDIRNSCVEYLQMIGYTVYGAQNSTEAFEIIKNNKPNILILDLNLKEKMTGIDILKKALEDVPSAQAAILTGLSENNVASQCYDAGAKMILKKPMAIEKFQDAVEQLIKGAPK